jgi:hypothetical protein
MTVFPAKIMHQFQTHPDNPRYMYRSFIEFVKKTDDKPPVFQCFSMGISTLPFLASQNGLLGTGMSGGVYALMGMTFGVAWWIGGEYLQY